MNKFDRGMGRWGSVILLSLGTSVGCSAGNAEDAAELRQTVLPEECEALGEAINKHTCLHGVYGPFVSVSTSDPDELTQGIHTWFWIELNGSGPYSRTLEFSPVNNDDHAIYFGPSVSVTVEGTNGPVASQLNGSVPACSTLTGLQGEDLTGYEVFELVAAHAPCPSFTRPAYPGPPISQASWATATTKTPTSIRATAAIEG